MIDYNSVESCEVGSLYHRALHSFVDGSKNQLSPLRTYYCHSILTNTPFIDIFNFLTL